MRSRQRSRTLVLFAGALGSMVLQTAWADNPAVTVSVDANANRHAINPEVYGVASASTTALQDLNVPLNRYGGNTSTTYNWQQNADNRGNDWYFESIGDTSSVAGERGDSFIANTKAAGAKSMITIPMADWVAKLGSNRSKLAAFSIAKYGAQTANDAQWFPDAGNGVKTNGSFVTNDPNDAFVANSSTLQNQWLQHIIAANGTAANGGAKYFIMDNEHAIWHSTHRAVQPQGVRMDTIKNKIIDYAGKVKAVDPTALVVGPEEWGWTGYFYSGYDSWYCGINGWSTQPDKAAHGNMDYMPWLLQQLKANNDSTGKRLLDVFSLHYYPQRGEYSDDTSTTMQQIRNQTTRDLWDPSYVSQSWIGQAVQLIPRMKSWVNTYYPGTKIGITEYSWGAENHINGATAQADIYGILGRENVDLAARWGTPASSTPTYKAMKMYRNYDGTKKTFGETSVSATVPNPDNVSAFAAQRTSDQALTVMVISKYLSANTPVTINMANFTPGTTAQVWQLTSANTITRLSDIAVSAGKITASLPAQSITLFVVPKGSVASSYYMYQEALAADWANWSWSDTVNFANTSPVKNGTKSISNTFTAAWAGFSLHKGTAQSTSGYTSVKFWIHGGSSNKLLNFSLQATDASGTSANVALTATANTWTEITVPLSSVGSPATVQRINLQDRSGAAQSAFYIDDIRLAP